MSNFADETPAPAGVVTEYTDQYTGQGGTFVRMPDGSRVPSDPETGEPVPPSSTEPPEAGAPTSDQE